MNFRPEVGTYVIGRGISVLRKWLAIQMPQFFTKIPQVLPPSTEIPQYRIILYRAHLCLRRLQPH